MLLRTAVLIIRGLVIGNVLSLSFFLLIFYFKLKWWSTELAIL